MKEKSKIINEKFADRLSKLIEENNINLGKLADITDLSEATISRYKNNKMSPKTPTVRVIAEYFGVNPVWLMGFDVPKYQEEKEEQPQNIAAHVDGKELTAEEIEEVQQYINYLISKRGNK